MNTRVLVLLSELSGTAIAADLPELVIPAGVGVNIHFTTGHARDLDRIAAAGFKFIRMDFGWGGIERVRGEYNWADYDGLTASLEQRGLRAIYILDYSNPLYEEAVVTLHAINGREQKETASPQHAESGAAFARWAAAAAKHFHGRRIVWEIWNEPKPAYIAIQTLTRELSGYRIMRRLEVGNEKDYLLLLTDAKGDEKLAAWTLAETHGVTLECKAPAGGRVTGVRGNGEPVAPRLEGNQLSLELAPEPKYLSLKGVKLGK